MGDRARDAVRDAAQRRPGTTALIAGDISLTWAVLDARVTTAARRLRGRADADGARVAIVQGNTIDFAVSYFGVLRAGLVAVPLNPGYTADELDFALADSGATMVIRAAADLGPGAEAEPPPVTADRLAVLLYTSGTSGRPKGAMLTHAALAANHDQLDRIEPAVVGPDDVVLLTVPFFHAYGLNTGLGTVAHHGATGVLVDRFDPAGSLELIARHGVTVTVGVPGMYAAWSREPSAGTALAGLRSAVCGAAPLDSDDAARFAAVSGHNVIIGYGLTECAPVLTTTAVSDVAKTTSIGRPLPGISLRLRTSSGEVLWEDGSSSPAEDLAELDLSVQDSAGTDPGEIVVRGANLFSGYWPDGRDGPGPDGWWATGDIAYADGDGDLHLVDRIGELILVNGFNVYPAEIERVLTSHPGVTEAAVLGVPDPTTGQVPHAYVVPALDPQPTEAELLVYCAAHLARFKLPNGIELVNSLPHSATGKVRKRELA
ncbi:MAG TPA: AMP-binding protein [Actinoplanes sp.]|nr:AMP-binding protein [Actinoplanes sp.]